MGFFGNKSSAANPRCNVSLKEATEFLCRLKRAEKELRTLHKTADGTLAGCKEVMNAPLPIVYAETATASGGAVRAVETIGGPGFSAEQLSRFNVELGQAMESQVFAPLAQWISNHTDAVAKQKVLQKLLSEVETRRSKVSDLKRKVDQLRAKQGISQANAKQADKLEELTKKLQHKESKLTIAESRYSEEEEQQYNKLVVLIKDAVYLRVFIKTALAQIAQALAAASESMLIFLPDQGQSAHPHGNQQQPHQLQMCSPVQYASSPAAQQQLPPEFRSRTMGNQPAAQRSNNGEQFNTWGPTTAGAMQSYTADADTAYPPGKSFGRSHTLSSQ